MLCRKSGKRDFSARTKRRTSPRARSRSSLAQRSSFRRVLPTGSGDFTPLRLQRTIYPRPRTPQDQGSGDLTNKSVAPGARRLACCISHAPMAAEIQCKPCRTFPRLRLLPNVDRDDNSLEGTCATKLEEAFDAAIDGQAFLLTNDGELISSGQSVVFPDAMFEVWPAEQVASLLDDAGRPALSRHLSGADRENLVQRGVVECVGKDHVLAALQSKHLPRPETWRRLLKLWAYLAPDVTDWRMTANRSKLRIFPAQGKHVLYSAGEVVRLGGTALQSEEDWEFLSAHLRYRTRIGRVSSRSSAGPTRAVRTPNSNRRRPPHRSCSRLSALRIPATPARS